MVYLFTFAEISTIEIFAFPQLIQKADIKLKNLRNFALCIIKIRSKAWPDQRKAAIKKIYKREKH